MLRPGLNQRASKQTSDYSTFIEDLETAADKLMSEVFELSETAPMPSPIRAAHSKLLTEPSFEGYASRDKVFLQKPKQRVVKKVTEVESSRTFRSFMDRAEYYSK